MFKFFLNDFFLHLNLISSKEIDMMKRDDRNLCFMVFLLADELVEANVVFRVVYVF